MFYTACEDYIQSNANIHWKFVRNVQGALLWAFSSFPCSSLHALVQHAQGPVLLDLFLQFKTQKPRMWASSLAFNSDPTLKYISFSGQKYRNCPTHPVLSQKKKNTNKVKWCQCREEMWKIKTCGSCFLVDFLDKDPVVFLQLDYRTGSALYQITCFKLETLPSEDGRKTPLFSTPYLEESVLLLLSLPADVLHWAEGS